MEIPKPQPKQPIPPEAKRVFKGIIFDVYQWEQKMYDGTTTTFERLKRPGTADVIAVLPDGKIMIANQEQPGKESYVGLLGGRLDENEEPLAAAKRELKEESGYESDEWSLFYVAQPVSKIDWTIYTFVARNCKKITDQKLDNGEKISLRPVTFEEFIELMITDVIHDPEIKMKFLEAKLDPQKMAELKKKILG